MIIVAAVFIVTLLAGIPIAFVLGLTGFIHLWTLDPSYFVVIPQRMFSGINNSSLTAIPFFIVAGELMNGGGLTERLLKFVKELVGFVKGGLAYATIGTAMILSSILGSSNAVASILCSILIPEMKKEGYEPEFGGALIAASGALGPIIPPSTTFIYYSVLSGASVRGLFMAGVVPGILIGLSYCIVVALYVRKKDLPRATDRMDLKRLGKSFIVALPALLVPFVIVGGVMTGVFTPTESGSVACVIAIITSIIYRGLDVKRIPRMMLRAGMASSGIMFIIASGNIMGWAMAIDNVPQLIQSTILGITSNSAIIIILMLLMLIVIGCLMEATAAMLIFTPVMLGLATSIGMDPLHFGLIFCVMLILAMVTPPVGMTLFVTSNIAEIEFTKLARAVIPFCVSALIIVAILAFMEDVVLFLPRLLLGY